MEFKNVEFRLHAVERMFERGISTDDVRRVIQAGKVIEDYPNDTPFPSCLVLGYARNKPLHVVIATDKETNRAITLRFMNLTLINGNPVLSGGNENEMRDL